MVKLYKPSILVLIEMKMEKKNLTTVLGYNAQVKSSSIDLTGGIITIRKDDRLQLNNLLITPKGIRTMIKIIFDPLSILDLF